MVERLDAPKVERPETSEEVIQEYKSELFDFKLEVKDQAKFESLLKDPVLQWAIEKIFNQVSDKAFWKEWRKLNELNISNVLEEYEKQNKWVRIIYAERNLWLKDVTSFENLTNEQKINFMALNDALKTEKTTEDIINKIKELQDKYARKMAWSLEWSHVKNFLQLKGVLKDYWLNNKEIQKFQELVELIDKNKMIMKKITEMMTYKGKFWEKMIVSGWWVVGFVIMTIIAWVELWYILFHKDSDDFEPEPVIVVKEDEPVQIEYIEGVEKCIFWEIWFTKSVQFDLKQYRQDNIDRTEWNPIFRFLWLGGLSRWARRWIKKSINVFQTRHVEIDLEWKMELEYNLDPQKSWTEMYRRGDTLVIETEEPKLKFSEDHKLTRKVDTEFIALDDFENSEYEEFQKWINDIKDEIMETPEYQQALEISVFSTLKTFNDWAKVSEWHQMNNIEIKFKDTKRSYTISFDDIDKYYDENSKTYNEIHIDLPTDSPDKQNN